MSAAPLSFVPAPRVTGDEPAVPVSTNAPHDARETTPDDLVLLPRHIADSAYHVLQAIHALKDNGSQELFRALSAALDKGASRLPVYLPPCDCCHVEVGQGFPHHPECWSEEAQRYRAAPVPQPAPFS